MNVAARLEVAFLFRKADGARKDFCSFHRVSRFQKRPAEVAMGSGMIGIELDHPAQCIDSFAWTMQVEQRATQTEPAHCVTGVFLEQLANESYSLC